MKPQMHADEHRLNTITFQVNGCAMDVINCVGHGFHEKIYENALAVAFEEKGLAFSQQKAFDIVFHNKKVGSFIPDFIIEDEIILEIKTIDKITNNEVGQVMNYLKACQLHLGLILNFKQAQLEWKRVIKT